MITDCEAIEKLTPKAIETVQNSETLEALAKNIKTMAKFHAAETIAEVINRLIKVKTLIKFKNNGIAEK